MFRSQRGGSYDFAFGKVVLTHIATHVHPACHTAPGRPLPPQPVWVRAQPEVDSLTSSLPAAFSDILLLLQIEDYPLTEAVHRTTVRKRPIA